MSDLSIIEIKKRLTKLLPDDNFRKICLAHFVESINEAHSYGQNKWGIYFDNKCIRLLVGNLILFTIHEKAIWITLDKQSLIEFKDKYDIITNSDYWQWDTGDYSEYNPIPSKPISSVNGYYFPSNNELEIWPIIRELHFNYVKKISTTYKALSTRSQLKHLDNLLNYIKNELNLRDIPFPNYNEIDFEIADEISSVDIKNLSEGGKKQITVNAYERNPIARRECLQKFGYKCSVCNFDFKEAYGDIGDGYIHVHHLKPLSEIKGEYQVDPINDLRPVCPNCHSMLHVGKLSIDQLKKKIGFQWHFSKM